MSIQLKRGLSSNIDQNYILKQGQIGIEMPTLTNNSDGPFRMKIGDGISRWSALPYADNQDLAESAKQIAQEALESANAADTKVNNVQSTADIAQTTANAALSKSGGTMTGQLSDVGSAQVRNVELTTIEPTAGASTDKPNGTIVLVYEV